jgi:cytoskeletal protein CcmA (bactofilin family)
MRTGRGLSIKGGIATAEDLTVDYEIDGTIDAPGHRVVIGEGAQVQAALRAATVVVHGRLDGHVSADRLELTATALVTASVVAPKLVLHDGAQLTGPVNTDRARAAASIARHRQEAAAKA